MLVVGASAILVRCRDRLCHFGCGPAQSEQSNNPAPNINYVSDTLTMTNLAIFQETITWDGIAADLSSLPSPAGLTAPSTDRGSVIW
jgi:hypothetical protein